MGRDKKILTYSWRGNKYRIKKELKKFVLIVININIVVKNHSNNFQKFIV